MALPTSSEGRSALCYGPGSPISTLSLMPCRRKRRHPHSLAAPAPPPPHRHLRLFFFPLVLVASITWAKLSSFALLLFCTPSYRVRLFVPSLRGKRCEVNSQADNVHQPWNQPRINAISVLTASFVPVTKFPELHRDAPKPGPRSPQWQ